MKGEGGVRTMYFLVNFAKNLFFFFAEHLRANASIVL